MGYPRRQSRGRARAEAREVRAQCPVKLRAGSGKKARPDTSRAPRRKTPLSRFLKGTAREGMGVGGVYRKKSQGESTGPLEIHHRNEATDRTGRSSRRITEEA